MKEKNKITLILAIILLVLLISIIVIAVIDGQKQETKKEVKETGTFYEIELENYYQEDKGILKDEFDYQNIIDKYEIKEEELEIELDFDKKDYLYYLFSYSPCSEEITFEGVTYKEKVATINLDVVMDCDFCIIKYKLLIIPVTKDKVKEVEVDLDIHESDDCRNMTEDKPILYLYPKEKTNVNVTLKYSDRILTSYPKYNNGWNVTAYPDGDLYDLDNKYYYALYWDEKNKTEVDFSEGFYVTKDNAISFLEEKLSLIGLNDKERNEFIMYWLPKLEKNEQSLIYFELTEERQNNNELIINPKPDSLLRINMHIKKVDEKVSIPEQKLTTFERVGFVAVEWGGTIH